MKQLENLICFDLSSYGGALHIVQQFVNDEDVILLEISPCGQGAILLIGAQELTALQFLQKEAYKLFSNYIISSQIVADVHSKLLPCYLSQESSTLNSHLVVFEAGTFSDAMQLASSALKTEKINIVDFRILRTFPINAILTLTTSDLSNFEKVDHNGFKKTIISKPSSTLKSLYEINSTIVNS